MAWLPCSQTHPKLQRVRLSRIRRNRRNTAFESQSCEGRGCYEPRPFFMPLFTGVRGRISMKMSSRRALLELGSVTQHRPHNVDPPTRQGDEGLRVPLALRPLAIVESPGLRGTAQAGKGRLVEDPL